MGVVDETFTIELVLEILEGESVVENVDISDTSGTLDYWASCDSGGSYESSEGDEYFMMMDQGVSNE